jgi:hypothetical protein
LLDKKKIEEILASKETFMFDCDGIHFYWPALLIQIKYIWTFPSIFKRCLYGSKPDLCGLSLMDMLVLIVLLAFLT